MNRRKTWRPVLEGLVRHFSRPLTPEVDPLAFVYRYETPEDRTVIAYLVSFLAFGRVPAIARAVEPVLEWLGPSPSRTLVRAIPAVPGRWRYRFVSAQALSGVLRWVRDRLERWGSLEAYFRERVRRASSLRAFAEAHGREGRRFFRESVPDVPAPQARFLFPTPPGSVCKRLALFVRWMTRPDPPDLGLWDFWPKAWVFVPVDTHLAFFARLWGWVEGRSLNWTFMERLASVLTALCPEDPLRYDYAISHLGMSGPCHPRPGLRRCGECLVRTVCPARERRALKARYPLDTIRVR